jgi:hypothetical protein
MRVTGWSEFHEAERKREERRKAPARDRSQKGGALQSLDLGVFIKTFTSCWKGSWLCLCVIGPFMGCMSLPASGHHRRGLHGPFSFPIGSEVQCTGWPSYQGVALFPCHRSFKAWCGFKAPHTCLIFSGKFPSSAPCPCPASPVSTSWLSRLCCIRLLWI